MREEAAQAIAGAAEDGAPRRTGWLAGPLGSLLAALAFFVIVVPAGLAMRALGRDRLRLRRDPAATSYWVAHRRRAGGPSR